MTRTRLQSMLVLAALALALLAAAPAARAQSLAEAGRNLAKQYGSAIVNVQIVLSQNFGGGGNENEVKTETSGTVISPDGLTIVPLSAVDPAQLIKRYVGGAEADQMNVSSRVKDLKLIVDKRQEVPAGVVLRDEDLNIAFLRPLKKPAAPMKFVDITQTAEAALLDEVLVLARLGRVADREMSVMSGEIQAIVTKPRKFYVPSSELASGGLGVPIFAQNGKFVGIVLMRTLAGGGQESGGGLFGMGGQSGMLVIILPAKDIQSEAAQAPKEVKETPKPEAPAPKSKPAKGKKEAAKPAK